MIPTDLHYSFPEAFYLFPVGIILLALLLRLLQYRSERIKSSFSPKVIRSILVPRSRYNTWAKAGAIFFIWMLAILALMQPRGNGHYPLEDQMGRGEKKGKQEKEAVVKRKAHDVIFLIDASASMDVNDTRTKVSRLEYAKEIADEIISRLKGESVALYAFTSDTTRLSPPTMDYLFVRLVMRDMDINEGDLAGTNVVEALSDFRDAFLEKITPKMKTLVVFTDGGDTHLEDLEGEARKAQIDLMLSVLGNPKENQLRVFTVGMGTEQGKTIPGVKYQGKQVTSSLDEAFLETLSTKGRGKYYFANQWTAMDLAADILDKFGEDEPLLEELKIKRSSGITRGKDDLVYELFFQVPLGAALFLLLWVLFFPDTRVRR